MQNVRVILKNVHIHFISLDSLFINQKFVICITYYYLFVNILFAIFQHRLYIVTLNSSVNKAVRITHYDSISLIK